MSKSIEDPAGTIMLRDSPDEASQKVMSATTDSLGVIKYDMENQTGISNLLQMLALLINQPLTEVIRNWEGKTSYGDLKTAVANEVKVFLNDFQRKLMAVEEAELMRKLEASEYLMRDVATQNLYKIQQAVGLRP
jgi:tryptophanyl-tRNA synthetase